MNDLYFEKKLMSARYPFPFWVDYQVREGAGMMCNAHYHNAIEIIYGYVGRSKVLLNGQTLFFGAGDLLLLNSNDVHSIIGLDERTEYLMVQFDPSLLYTGSHSFFEIKYLLPFTLTSSTHQKIFFSDEFDDIDIASLMENIRNESKNKDYGYELAIRTDISRIFLWMLRTWNKRGINLNIEDKITETSAARLQTAINFAKENFKNDICVEDVAKKCNVSYSYFSRFFKNITKRSFSDYVNFLRIAEAEKLLTESDMSITEIAYEVGFSSSSYFIAQFKNAKGISPMQYRKSFNSTI